MSEKNIYILGISESHNASAVLLKNGKIIGAYNEERFNRNKNYLGYPKNSIRQLLKDHKITGKDLNYIVLSFQRAIISNQGHKKTVDFLYKINLFLTYRNRFLNRLYLLLYELYLKSVNKKIYKKNLKRIAKDLNIPPKKIISFPHHLTHAASVVYGLGQAKKKVLVLTNDGAGDKYCASVSVYKIIVLTR